MSTRDEVRLEVSKLILERRRNTDSDWSDLAVKFGVSAATVRRWEYGTQVPRSHRLASIRGRHLVHVKRSEQEKRRKQAAHKRRWPMD